MQVKSTSLFFISILISLLSTTGLSAENWLIEDGILVVGATVDSIPAYAFAGNSDVREVKFEPRPDSRPLRLGDYSFMECRNLKSLNLPDFVVAIGEGCFRNCESLQSLKLPAKLKGTPRYMAAWCINLRDVTLPTGLKKIGAHSFAYCSSLPEIKLPDGLVNIENNAFSRATSLTEVTIPKSVTALESYAFSDCVQLTKCVLPANPALLGELIFSGCENLKELIELSPTPPPFDCNSFIFEPDDSDAYRRCRLIVPTKKIPLYRTARGWNLFFQQSAPQKND